GRQDEARPVDAEPARRAQQTDDVIDIGLAWRQRYVWYGVERGPGRDAAHAGYCVDPPCRDLRPFPQRGTKRPLVCAVSVQRSDEAVLHRSGAAEASFAEFVDRRCHVPKAFAAPNRDPTRPP